jgi:phosphatidylserine/phosphatidylglycerophosphate/cardiolipin synthase-like enzyme
MDWVNQLGQKIQSSFRTSLCSSIFNVLSQGLLSQNPINHCDHYSKRSLKLSWQSKLEGMPRLGLGDVQNYVESVLRRCYRNRKYNHKYNRKYKFQYRHHQYKYGLTLLLSFAVTLGIVGCQWLPGSNAQSLPQHPHIQVFMNQNPANRYTDPYRNITREGDNLEQVLIDTIGQAKQTIDLAIQELRLPNLAQALVDAQNRGVRVRLILENQYSRPWSEYTFDEVKDFNSRRREAYNEFLKFVDTNRDGTVVASEWEARDALLKLRKANIPWLDDTADGSKGSGLMHHKFMVIDNQVVVVTSANFTLSDIHGDFSNPDSRGNANNLLKISHGELAGLFGQEFQLMWGDGPGGKTDSLFGVQKPSRKIAYFVLDNAQIRLKFSPDRKSGAWEQSSNGLIATVLSGAQQSVSMALFVYSDPRIGTILQHRHENNINIRVLLDSQFAYRKYSSALNMWGFVSTADCQLGDGTPWAKRLTTVGVPSLNSGDKLHHKFAVLDENMVITGSHNWTNAANYNNDETVLVVQSPIVAAHFQREFERLYKNATFGPNAKVRQSAPRSCNVNSTPSKDKPSNDLVPKSNKMDDDE